MIGYTLFGTNQIERAKSFYDHLFALVDAKRAGQGKDWDAPMCGITKPYDGNAATVGNGTMIAIPVGGAQLSTISTLKHWKWVARTKAAPGFVAKQATRIFTLLTFATWKEVTRCFPSWPRINNALRPQVGNADGLFIKRQWSLLKEVVVRMKW